MQKHANKKPHFGETSSFSVSRRCLAAIEVRGSAACCEVLWSIAARCQGRACRCQGGGQRGASAASVSSPLCGGIPQLSCHGNRRGASIFFSLTSCVRPRVILLQEARVQREWAVDCEVLAVSAAGGRVLRVGVFAGGEWPALAWTRRGDFFLVGSSVPRTGTPTRGI